MLKILYAAGNTENSKIQLARFINAVNGKPYSIKVAAYKRSSPPINIDWTLDCLLNVFKPEHITLDNDNFSTYFEQVKYYNPDLIISDLEFFTSHIANVLGKPVWQCSSSLINFALTTDYKYGLGIFKQYAYLMSKNPIQSMRLTNVIDNSVYNFVYSHLGDSLSPPTIKENYQWIRPYHQVGKLSIPCQHNMVAGTLKSNKQLIALLKKYEDSVYFTDFKEENFLNLNLKDIMNQEEYYCNLRNSNLFICEGQTSFLADAFYNGKYAIVLTNLNDMECIVNSTISEKLKLSKSIYQISDELNVFDGSPTYLYNQNIKFLHEKIADHYQ